MHFTQRAPSIFTLLYACISTGRRCCRSLRLTAKESIIVIFLVSTNLNRAMDNGLTAQEAGEIVTNAAFYAGWPNAFSAAPVVGEVLRARGLVR
ncbi:carboxymuconolactone decarboxylase family protein [Klebsiella huaxiensis]